MSPVYVFVHGWGFGAAFWAPMRAQFAPQDTLAWDLGFFGVTQCPELPEGRKVIAVGHSLGGLWLLHEKPFAWDRLVAVNGFSCFARRGDFAAGVAPRVLGRMRAQVGDAPEAVLAAFYGQLGYKGPVPLGANGTRLADGLAALEDWDERPAQPDLALCGEADPLVSREMSAACFERIVWHKGGHLLPAEDPEWCVARLRGLGL
jgi:pimeloyl-[acyl-carrier protein] methyl ester esterase